MCPQIPVQRVHCHDLKNQVWQDLVPYHELNPYDLASVIAVT